MHVRKVTCVNYGPIERLSIDFPTRADGKPTLVVLVGQNGAGKSLILSAILDALVEIKRATYDHLPEIPKNELFRLQKKDYIRVGTDYSHIVVEVTHDDSTAKLTELVRKIPKAEFEAKYPAATFPDLQIGPGQGHYDESGFFKSTIAPEAVKTAFKKNVLLYFPYFRYEPPAWLNPRAGLTLDTREDMYGQSTDSLVKTNIIQELESWVLDVILDMELYEKQLVPLQIGAAGEQAKLFAGYSGRNATSRQLLNQILTTIYRAKDPTVERARIGISSKANRRISVIVKRHDEEEIPVAPTFLHLSSGEVMTFAIAGSIVREHDQKNFAPAEDLAHIRGTVLIDEIDLHLHIQLQKEILPALIDLFPNIQFIVTTHSPFFLLGLAKRPDLQHLIYRLPHGQRIAAEDFEEFQDAYDTFIAREAQFKQAYDGVAAHLKQLERPLVITEGKTDWKHMKAALSRLQAGGEYQDLVFDFHEYESTEMGDSALRSMCEQFAKVPQGRRVVFIFDRDNPTITAAMETADTGIKSWGNNVVSFCTPVPPHRAQYERISIEFYYADEDLRVPDPATGYRLVFSNEVKRIVESSATIKGSSQITVRLRNAPVEAEEFQKGVYDQDCERIVDAAGNRVAHSKTVFAEKVAAATPPFHEFDIAPFRALLDKLRLALTT